MATNKLFRRSADGTAPLPSRRSEARSHEPDASRSAKEPRWLKVADLFSLSLALLGGVAAAVLAINVILDVVGRSFFAKPLPGTLDLTTYAWMPTLVSLGLGYALLRGEHIRVSLLTAAASPRVQRAIEIVGMAFITAVAVALAYYGAQKAINAGSYGESAVGTPWLTIWPFRWVVVVGLAGLALQGLAQFVRVVRMKDFNPDAFDQELEAL